MKEIPLTRDFMAIVDDEDYQSLSNYSWHTTGSKKHRTKYASRSWRQGGKYHHLAMHRHILGLTENDSIIVDHINGNGLDNRRNNLRISDVILNQYNSRLRVDNTSGYKGVVFHKASGTWNAKIKVKGKRICLGYYKNPLDAALAYDKAAILYRGRDLTTVNFKEGV